MHPNRVIPGGGGHEVGVVFIDGEVVDVDSFGGNLKGRESEGDADSGIWDLAAINGGMLRSLFDFSRISGIPKGTQLEDSEGGADSEFITWHLLLRIGLRPHHAPCVPIPVYSRSGSSRHHRRTAGPAKGSLPIATAAPPSRSDAAATARLYEKLS